MSDTNFQSGTVVRDTWINDANDSVYQGKNPSFVTSTGSVNAYVVTLPSSTLTEVQNGQLISFKANLANTTAATLTIIGQSTVGPTSIQNQGFALTGGDIAVNDYVTLVYLNSVWNLVTVSRNAHFNDVLIDGDLTFGAGATIDGEAYTDLAFLSRTQSFRKAQRGTLGVLTDNTTITPDFATANNFSLTIGGSRTLANPTNMAAGQSGMITITQDGSGNHTLAYGNYWKWAGGIAPILSTPAGTVDVLVYFTNSTTFITAKLIKAIA